MLLCEKTKTSYEKIAQQGSYHRPDEPVPPEGVRLSCGKKKAQKNLKISTNFQTRFTSAPAFWITRVAFFVSGVAPEIKPTYVLRQNLKAFCAHRKHVFRVGRWKCVTLVSPVFRKSEKCMKFIIPV